MEQAEASKQAGQCSQPCSRVLSHGRHCSTQRVLGPAGPCVSKLMLGVTHAQNTAFPAPGCSWVWTPVCMAGLREAC